MNQDHSAQQVATTIRDLFKKKGMQLKDFANEQGISINNLYVALKGDKYLSANLAFRFNQKLGISFSYCVSGMLPVMDPNYEFDELLSAATWYKKADETEDRLRDDFERNEENLSPEEKAAYKKAIAEARMNKMKESVELAALLKKGWNEDGDEEETQADIPSIYTPVLKLHEAIEMVINEAGRPLTFTEIAKQINAKNLYTRKDRKLVPSSQISARIENYPTWFAVNRDEKPATVSVIHNK